MDILFDTNAVIYFLEDKLTAPLKDNDIISISFITELELLGKELKPEEQGTIEQFLKYVKVIGITDEIKRKTIELRKLKGLKLPDAIIVATAQVYGMELWTADKEILKKISDSPVKNPIG